MHLETAEVILCQDCSPIDPAEFNQCCTCHVYYCQHLSCKCPPRTLTRREVLQESIWEAETEVWQLNEVERKALLTEWQRGKRRMLSSRIDELRNLLKIS